VPGIQGVRLMCEVTTMWPVGIAWLAAAAKRRWE